MSLLLGPAYKSFARETGLDEPFRRFIIGKRDEHLDTTGGIHGSGKSWPNAVLRGLFVQRELFTPTGDVPVFLDFGSSIGAQVIMLRVKGGADMGLISAVIVILLLKIILKSQRRRDIFLLKKQELQRGTSFQRILILGVERLIL